MERRLIRGVAENMSAVVLHSVCKQLLEGVPFNEAGGGRDRGTAIHGQPKLHCPCPRLSLVRQPGGRLPNAVLSWSQLLCAQAWLQCVPWLPFKSSLIILAIHVCVHAFAGIFHLQGHIQDAQCQFEVRDRLTGSMSTSMCSFATQALRSF